MSLFLDKKENVIAYILNDNDQKVYTVSFMEKGDVDAIELDDNHHFQLAPGPTKEKERMTMFVAGESGAGKSYFVKQYAIQYKNMFPRNDIYLISYLEYDETLDTYDEITRLNAFKPEFLAECLKIDMEDFQDTLVIFDDIDSIVNKKQKTQIYGLLNKMLRIGRHYNISVCYSGHELYSNHELKAILNESMTVTFSPKFLNFKKMKYLLEEYFGLSKTQIQRIRDIKDRSVTYIKGSDKVILSTSQCFILN